MSSHSHVLLAVALCSTVIVASAASLDQAKAGMRERVPAIDKLKETGAVGEGNTGLLAVRKPGAEAEKTVAAENADRAVLFAEIAKKTGGTPESAGKEFARQLAKASKPGVWVQREDGAWYRK